MIQREFFSLGMNSLFYLKLNTGGGVIQNVETVVFYPFLLSKLGSSVLIAYKPIKKNERIETTRSSQKTSHSTSVLHFPLRCSYVWGHVNDTTKSVRWTQARQCSKFCGCLKMWEALSLTNDMFGVKDPIFGGLLSLVIFKLAREGRNACYVCETVFHFSLRVKEHLASSTQSIFYTDFVKHHESNP